MKVGKAAQSTPEDGIVAETSSGESSFNGGGTVTFGIPVCASFSANAI